MVAKSELVDPNFFHTVVLLLEHNESGAMGVVLNRPAEIQIEQVWSQIAEDDSACGVSGPIHQGGPCQGPLMAVHTDETVSQMQVIPGVYFTAMSEQIRQLGEQDQPAVVFFVGYAGWSAGQLESELNEGSWYVTEAKYAHIFGPKQDLWQELNTVLGGAIVFPGMSSVDVPDDPSAN